MTARVFKPVAANATLNIDVSAASQSVTLTGHRGRVNTVRVMNNGTATVWIEIRAEATAAVLASSIPVGPGVHEIIEIGNLSDAPNIYCSAIAAGATGKIYFTPGEGS